MAKLQNEGNKLNLVNKEFKHQHKMVERLERISKTFSEWKMNEKKKGSRL